MDFGREAFIFGGEGGGEVGEMRGGFEDILSAWAEVDVRRADL